ncbi:hypothetical protein Nepgr_031263 [Nepenthes gracilis]|uniref:Uncharacterized protein n=1 Tax=Nepenthes gracilis TaxID=150966 RepID=A0AAD3TGD1_NEPGR|nr:hypothetical protein Nepgr_031263 [Nepenthes gracilis]
MQWIGEPSCGSVAALSSPISHVLEEGTDMDEVAALVEASDLGTLAFEAPEGLVAPPLPSTSEVPFVDLGVSMPDRRP